MPELYLTPEMASSQFIVESFTKWVRWACVQIADM
jgi:hypothetical protein